MLLNCNEGMSPGGKVLLLVIENAEFKRTLLQIDALEAVRTDPAEASPAYYRHVHNCVSTGQPVRAHSRAQHEAHLASLRVA